MKPALLSWKSFLSCLALGVLFSAGAAQAQVAAPEATGVDPSGSYTGGNFDLVDLSNGNVNLHIPLVSYKQKGKLALSFSLDENTNIFRGVATCAPTEDDCYEFYSVADDQFGPQITFDQGMNLGGDSGQTAFTFSWGDGSSQNYVVYWSFVTDNRGGTHNLGFDANSFPPPYYQGNSTVLMHANDGSGYTFTTTPDIYEEGYASGTLTNADGVSIPVCASYSCYSPDIDMTDSNGNAIHTQYGTDPMTGQQDEFQYLDSSSVPLVIPSPPPPPEDQYGDLIDTPTPDCPNLGIANEPALAEETWWVPGHSSSGYVPYILCYTSITFRTAFWGPGNDVYMGNPYEGGITGNGPSDPWTFDTTGGAYPIQSIVLPAGAGYWGFVYDTSGLNPPVDDLDSWPVSYGDLAKVILPTGGTIGYTYNNELICYVPPDDPYVRQNRVATSRTVNDNNGNVETWNYSIQGSTATVTDPLGNDAVHTFSGLGNDSNCDMHETDVKQYQGPASGGNVLQETETAYQYVTSPQTLYFPDADQETDILPQTVTVLRNGSAYTTTNYTYPSLFSNVQPYYENVGEDNSLSDAYAVSFNQPSAVVVNGVNSGYRDTTTEYQYQQNANYLNANLLNLHYQNTTLDSSGNIAAQATYNYDEGESGVYGNQTSVYQQLNGSPVKTSSTVYNSNGMPTTINDALGYDPTSINYDHNSGIFPSTVTANGLTYQYVFDDNAGLVDSELDPNNVNTAYNYDALRRLTLIDSAAGTAYEAKTAYSYPNSNEMDTNQDKTALGDGLLHSKTIYDGLARPIHQTQPSGAVVDTTYDNLGNTASVSNPYFSSGDSTYGITSYAYDALGRKLYQCQPDNGSNSPCVPGAGYLQWLYNGITTDFYDEDRHHWRSFVDGLGRLQTVLEPDASDNPDIPTYYQYDANGNLAAVTQQGVSGETPRTRGFNYDSLSRLTSAANPETGTVSYAYDLDGNLTTKTDARGVTVGYCYDHSNRMIYKFYTGSFSCANPTGYAAQYSYDVSHVSGAQYTVGRLTDEKSYAGGTLVSERQPYAYDALGRLLNENQYTLAGLAKAQPYPVAYQYNLAGSLIASTDGTTLPQTPYTPAPCSEPLPGWTTLTFIDCYDGAGRLLSVTANWSDSTHPAALFSAPAYAAPGELTGAALGAGAGGASALNLNRIYDSRLRIASETDVGNGGTQATGGSATVTVTGAEQSQ